MRFNLIWRAICQNKKKKRWRVSEYHLHIFGVSVSLKPPLPCVLCPVYLQDPWDLLTGPNPPDVQEDEIKMRPRGPWCHLACHLASVLWSPQPREVRAPPSSGHPFPHPVPSAHWSDSLERESVAWKKKGNGSNSTARLDFTASSGKRSRFGINFFACTSKFSLAY